MKAGTIIAITGNFIPFFNVFNAEKIEQDQS